MGFIDEFTVKESGNRDNENYILYERDTNLLLICREESSQDAYKALDYMSEDMFANMAETLDTKSNIVAYVYQAEGTTSDVTLFDRKDMDTAEEVFNVVSKRDLSNKYMDFTSSADTENERDFADAIANISVDDKGIER